MEIHTAAIYMDMGYRIRRASKDADDWITKDGVNSGLDKFSIEDLLADDWVVITEGVKTYFPITY